MPSNEKKNTEITWNPKNVFSGTAWFYAHYRPNYPDEVIDLLRKRFKLSNKSRILDLGCGTGQIAFQIAKYVSEVIAVDPQEDMLKEGQKLTENNGISNIKWIIGESGDIPRISSHIHGIDLTVIARAFHWMDKEQILKDLYKITKLDGGIAIISDSGPRDGQMIPWKETIDQLVKKWLGEQRKAGTQGTYSHPTKRFETTLRESEFRDLEHADFNIERIWTIDQIIGYLYSTSSSSIPVLGESKEPFEAELRVRLKELDPTEQFREQVKVNVLMVWKR
jgi:ubiquinone/menaquinone biosynthesis C-methylase UbiE